MAVRDALNPNKNPFFQHAEFGIWNSYRKGQCVGRVVAGVDRTSNSFHNERVVFFGFLEILPDPSALRALMEEVRQFGLQHGMEEIRGPLNLSTNYECGLLVEGFEERPMVMMNYHPPYYRELLEAAGFTKSKDLFAYTLSYQNTPAERMTRVAERLRQRRKVEVRSVEPKHFWRDVEIIRQLYNDAWEKNWGFVPMDAAEFNHLARDLKLIADLRICFIATVEGSPAGFGLALPDVNQLLAQIPDGRLTLGRILRLVWQLKGGARRRSIHRARIITVGIAQRYRDLGLGAIFYAEYYRQMGKVGYRDFEASWILEDNGPMNQALVALGGNRSKTYRIYSRAIDACAS